MWDGQMRGLRGIRVNRERGACLPPCLPFPLPYLTECEICAKERAGAGFGILWNIRAAKTCR